MVAPADENNKDAKHLPNKEALATGGDRSETERQVSNAGAVSSTAARLRAEAAGAMAKLTALSPREREVIDFIAEGLSVKEIARRLDVSPKSVETYRARLIEKLDAKSPTALMRIAVLVSLMEPREHAAPDREAPPEKTD